MTYEATNHATNQGTDQASCEQDDEDRTAVYVVGVDGSACAAHAACRAAALAHATGARLHVVCAHGTASDTVLHVGSDVFEFSAATRAEALAQTAASAVHDLCPDTTWAAVHGDPAETLLAEASDLGASLIVLGSHGLGGLSEMLGSVTEKVLHHTPCDVLVVRA